MQDFKDCKLLFNLRFDEPIKDWLNESNYINHFKSDWNELMPLVEMAYHNGAEGNEIGDITHALLDCNIEATYDAVLAWAKTFVNDKD